jgi:hypothetical protein
MPYRRLPNTDIKRLKALKRVIDLSEKPTGVSLPFSFVTLQQVKNNLPNFEREIIHQNEALKQQVERQKEYAKSFRKAQLYISHFLQVMNMAVLRGDLPSAAKKYYIFSDNNIPAFSSESELVKIGKKVIQAEKERILDGGNPITNPTIALVNVKFEKFIELNILQKNLKENYMRASHKVAEYRPIIDKLIQTLWNEIENSFSNLGDEEKRKMSSEYGVEYVFRRTELDEKVEIENNLNYTNIQKNDISTQYSLSF